MPRTRRHYLAVLDTGLDKACIWQVSYKERKECLAVGNSRHLLSGLCYTVNYPVRKASIEEIRAAKRKKLIYKSLSPEVTNAK